MSEHVPTEPIEMPVTPQPRAAERMSTLSEVALAITNARDSAERLRMAADWYSKATRQQWSQLLDSLQERPPSTGDLRWNALLAGLVEQLCLGHAALVPSWAMAPEYFLETWWFLSPYASLHASAYLEAPAALANRGVFVHAADLMSL